MLAGFLDGVLNVNTGFFRHPGAMNALARHVMPQLYARKSDDGPCTLRIWSAGCGTGEEAYSIAMALCERAAQRKRHCATVTSNGNGTKTKTSKKSPQRNGGIAESSVPASYAQGTKDWSMHIVGSDLLPLVDRSRRARTLSAIRTGRLAARIHSRLLFENRKSRTARRKRRKADQSNGSGNGAGEWLRSNGAHLLVKPRLRSLVTFNTMNLTKPVYIGRFDCIFCMDVLPHLSRAQRTALMERLHLYLEPGGYLFLSQTEKLCAPNLNFRPETFDGYTFHRKPLAASAAYGR